MAPKADSDVVPGPAENGPGWLVWLGALTVSGSAAALSFASLSALARACGVSPGLDWLFPIAIDAGVLVSTKFWLTPGLADRATRFARTLMLALIAVSCVFNVSIHLLTPVPGTPFLLSAAVSLLPPLALAGVIHLMVLSRAKTAPAAPAEPVLPLAPEALLADPGPAAADAASEPSAAAPAEPAAAAQIPAKTLLLTDPGKGAAASDEVLLAQLRADAAAGKPIPSKRALMRDAGIGDARASRLLAALTTPTNGHARPDLVAVK